MHERLPCPLPSAEAHSYIGHTVISYSLQCSQGHRSEAWFKSAAAYDEQQARGLVVCAQCGDSHVEKAPMAPAVARTDGERVAVSSAHPDAAKFWQMLREYRRMVLSQAENVGPRFAEEARKIHFEEADARGIYGEATRDEVAGLLDDGIEFLPLPDVGEDN